VKILEIFLIYKKQEICLQARKWVIQLSHLINSLFLKTVLCCISNRPATNTNCEILLQLVAEEEAGRQVEEGAVADRQEHQAAAADAEPGKEDQPADGDAAACRNRLLNNAFLISKLRALFY